MKNFLSHFSLKKLFFLSFLIAGFFILSSSGMHAQSAKTDQVFSVPQGQFVNVATAIIRLDNALSTMKVQLSNMDPNSQAYKDLEAKYTYFNTIKVLLEEGKGTDSQTVANAIADGLAYTTTDAYGGIDLKKVLTFKQDAINLLRI